MLKRALIMLSALAIVVVCITEWFTLSHLFADVIAVELTPAFFWFAVPVALVGGMVYKRQRGRGKAEAFYIAMIAGFFTLCFVKLFLLVLTTYFERYWVGEALLCLAILPIALCFYYQKPLEKNLPVDKPINLLERSPISSLLITTALFFLLFIGWKAFTMPWVDSMIAEAASKSKLGKSQEPVIQKYFHLGMQKEEAFRLLGDLKKQGFIIKKEGDRVIATLDGYRLGGYRRGMRLSTMFGVISFTYNDDEIGIKHVTGEFIEYNSL